jgi:hypothetical protein
LQQLTLNHLEFITIGLSGFHSTRHNAPVNPVRGEDMENTNDVSEHSAATDGYQSDGMTVRQLIEWLGTQDQGAKVEVLERVEGREYYGDTFYRRAFHPADYAEYTDMRGNKFAKGEPYENDRTLFLGCD